MSRLSRPRPITPGPGQESVWDYPRPPRVEVSTSSVRIELDGSVIADTVGAVRVLETSHPPVDYLPRSAFASGVLSPAEGESWCEFKGKASYWNIGGAERAAWSYEDPSDGFEILRGMIAVYPSRMDKCTVDGEIVSAQEGGFYGGWVTSRVVGPFKGAPGSSGW